MRASGLFAVIALAAALAGCGSSSSSSSSASSTSSAPAATSSSAAAGAASLTLSESEFKIRPAAPAIGHTGKLTIAVKNTGKVNHALTVDTPSGPVSTSSIAPGATATLTLDLSEPGHYTFFCPIPGHRQAGMVGTLTVS